MSKSSPSAWSVPFNASDPRSVRWHWTVCTQTVGSPWSDAAPAGSDRLDQDVVCVRGEGFDVLFVAGEDGAARLGQGHDDRIDS